MSAEKYQVKNAKGEIIWTGMALTKNEAINCAILEGGNTEVEDMTAEVVVEKPVKVRKTRSDKEQSRGGMQAKRVRSRGTYFVCRGILASCSSENDVFAVLERENIKPNDVRIVQGNERTIQYKLSPVKEVK